MPFFIQPLFEARAEIFRSFLEALKVPQFPFEVSWPLSCVTEWLIPYNQKAKICNLYLNSIQDKQQSNCSKQNQSWQPLNWCHPCVKHSNPMLFSSRIDIFFLPYLSDWGGQKRQIASWHMKMGTSPSKTFSRTIRPKIDSSAKVVLKNEQNRYLSVHSVDYR